MKAWQEKDLWVIDVLTVLLIVIIAFLPFHTLRIILGLPLVLFFPGYNLVAALFPRKKDLSGVERVALSFGLSIAVVPLMGLILNYTPWGISLYPVLVSLVVFVLVASVVAWYRRGKLTLEDRFKVSLNIKVPSWWGQGKLDKALSIVLVVAIVGALGTLGYVVASPKEGERFTEFYILGHGGMAEDYPMELEAGEEGTIILGIVNHEQEKASYQVELWIDGEKSKLGLDGEYIDELELELEHEEKWEGEVGFKLVKAGERQKVEFVLFKDGVSYFEEPLHLWIDVI